MRSKESQDEFIRSGCFRDRLDKLLEERGLTRSWLAFQMGVSEVTLCVMLKRNNPKLFTVLQMARILDIPAAELIAGCEEYIYF